MDTIIADSFKEKKKYGLYYFIYFIKFCERLILFCERSNIVIFHKKNQKSINIIPAFSLNWAMFFQ